MNHGPPPGGPAALPLATGAAMNQTSPTSPPQVDPARRDSDITARIAAAARAEYDVWGTDTPYSYQVECFIKMLKKTLPLSFYDHLLAVPQLADTVYRFRGLKHRHVGATILQLLAAGILEPSVQVVDKVNVTCVQVALCSESNAPRYDAEDAWVGIDCLRSVETPNGTSAAQPRRAALPNLANAFPSSLQEHREGDS